MSLSLILDTSGRVFSLSIFDCDKIIKTFNFSNNNRFSSSIFSFVNYQLMDLGITLKDVDYYGVSVGPGSYTGIRIGVSFCLGACYSLNKNLVYINVLDAFKSFYDNYSDYVYPVIDANNNNVYTLVNGNVCKINVNDFKKLIFNLKSSVSIISTFDFISRFNINESDIKNVIVDNVSKTMFKLFIKKVRNNEFCDIYNYNIDYYD